MAKKEDDKYPYIPKSDEALREQVHWIKVSRPPPSTLAEFRELIYHKMLISNKKFTFY